MRRAPLRMITLFLLAGVALGTVPPVATADYIVYKLDQSNTLANGPEYGTVKVEADTGLGDIKLTFAAATAPYSAGGPNFGFHTVGFNTDLDLKSGQFTLPAGWKLTGSSSTLSSFGKFTWKVSTSNQQSPSVTVQIDGLAGDATAAHFALPSVGGDSVFFAGHVMDFTLKGSDVTSHWVGGSAPLPPPDDQGPPPPSGQGETPPQTPEPSSLVLGLGALAGLGLTRLAHRRRVPS